MVGPIAEQILIQKRNCYLRNYSNQKVSLNSHVGVCLQITSNCATLNDGYVNGHGSDVAPDRGLESEENSKGGFASLNAFQEVREVSLNRQEEGPFGIRVEPIGNVSSIHVWMTWPIS